MGHRAGAKTIRRVVEAAPKIGIEYLTLYAFSTENWIRPKEEVVGLMQLFEEQLRQDIDELDTEGVRILTIGGMDGVPDGTRKAFENAAERTKDNTTLTLVVAINYSGRAEIVDAVRAICNEALEGNKIPEIDEENFSHYLYTSNIPDPELLIRTSGELRISNFLLWQIAYAEFWVTETLWPDFTEADLVEAVADFQTRKRRFGGLGKD
jgi:undecaprenyl diphosphate synthase